MQPQRLIVPLFQRPYVWNRENQWAPLWADVVRVAERVLSSPQSLHTPHFLGAVVVQQVQNPVGSMQERSIIDGQQRLTTLQLLLDALHAELEKLGATQPAMRIEALVCNAEAFWDRPEDRFKVWPTNRDRPAFNAVMSAEPPIDYRSVDYRGARLVEAHRFFAEQAASWLCVNGQEDLAARSLALERVVRELLQVVVIDLTADENAQEIFETLNARGAQLTAADLIKNFIFQRLMEVGVDVEAAYETAWKEFETGFWESEVSVGRVRYSRSSIFLNHWLVARTGEEIVAREVFSRFKQYSDFDATVPMEQLLGQIDRAASVYRSFVEAAANYAGEVDRLGLFAYRTSTLESEVFKPFVLLLLDPEEDALPPVEVNGALDALESWLVRRMLVRATTSGYNQIAVELITELRKCGRETAGAATESFLRNQTAPSRYWPDDDEVRSELSALQAYRRLRRPRLRMVLEAVEDHWRGWRDDREGLGGQRILRCTYAIEHIMPRKWESHWPLPPGEAASYERDQLIQTLGNLTLLTGRLNANVSNGAWQIKRSGLKDHDVLKLNMTLLDAAGDAWDEPAIQQRTRQLTDAICEIWPVPDGHRSGHAARPQRERRTVDVADLIGAGLIEPGATLYVRRRGFADRTATVLPDGQIDVEGIPYGTPSGAAKAIYGKNANGWRFFRITADKTRPLSDLWHEFVDSAAVDADDSENPEGDDEGDI
jgi:hypothetical protein